MISLSEIKCIVIDVDGTITSKDNTLDLNAIEMLRKLKRDIGLKVILASGNAYPVLMGLARYIGGIDYVIAENGGVMGLNGEIEVIGDKKIGEKAREIIKRELGDILIESWQCMYRLVDFSFKVKHGIEWEYAYKKTMEVLSRMIPEAKAVFSGVAIHVSDRRVNKGVALKRVMEKWNLKRENVMAIGDSDVDVEMLMEAGFSVAVANASENAKKVAKIITRKPYGEGFIEISEKILEEFKTRRRIVNQTLHNDS
ncbi:MAG: phosphoglycolate phosphatase [archaeon GBS-70-058]|nr:phosphoglycolate phosphatase [Candidatus Culexarchaeum nevadense]